MELLGGGDHRPVVLGDLRGLELLFRQSHLDIRSILMSLSEQIATLNERVTTLEGAVTTLGEKVDAEQVQVQAAIELLSADNPDVAAAITKLEAVAANLGTITSDVESTIPDAPPPA